eukprot:365038-Chlamydomonas_euryale.AAC.11
MAAIHRPNGDSHAPAAPSHRLCLQQCTNTMRSTKLPAGLPAMCGVRKHALPAQRQAILAAMDRLNQVTSSAIRHALTKP